MSDEKHTGEVGSPRLQKLICKRIGQQVTLDEHGRCPYCHGKIEDIASGDHEVFCNYDPTQDPIHFGFPEGTDREERG